MTTVERRGQDRRRAARGGRRATDRSGEYPPVLIADSDDGVRRVCVRYLHRCGFQVTEARNGEDAAAVLDTFRPHLVIMELTLPSTSRFRTRLMNDGHIPVIVTTTDEDAPVPPDTAAVLSKPFALQALLHDIRRVLNAHPMTGVGDRVPRDE